MHETRHGHSTPRTNLLLAYRSCLSSGGEPSVADHSCSSTRPSPFLSSSFDRLRTRGQSGVHDHARRGNGRAGGGHRDALSDLPKKPFTSLW